MSTKLTTLLIACLKSRSMWAAIIMAFLTALEVNMQLVTPWLPPTYRPYLALVWAPVMIFFRFITSTALVEK